MQTATDGNLRSLGTGLSRFIKKVIVLLQINLNDSKIIIVNLRVKVNLKIFHSREKAEIVVLL